MRTTAWIDISSTLARIKEPKRCFDVYGKINMIFNHEPPSDDTIQLLWKLVQEFDVQEPWRDRPDPRTGEPIKSIAYISHETVELGKTLCRRFKLCLRIAPGITAMKRSQVMAYEKYLANLGDRLAKRLCQPGFTCAELVTIAISERPTRYDFISG